MNIEKRDDWKAQIINNETVFDYENKPEFDLMREYANQLNGQVDDPSAIRDIEE
ncbi:hypothetical protein [Paenibacillus sedimenti]|uniref:Uncharacterized protein n=1 Tax=Paenibacillus sedimenti TaxID=2770274 RepID=A0A926KQZ8_9BACL|nr:hypothetical protein [Paenibacillus sedimenti]MBD0381541.1 hypothetical protein [Paenibacillus sedimenti]